MGRNWILSSSSTQSSPAPICRSSHVSLSHCLPPALFHPPSSPSDTAGFCWPFSLGTAAVCDGYSRFLSSHLAHTRLAWAALGVNWNWPTTSDGAVCPRSRGSARLFGPQINPPREESPDCTCSAAGNKLQLLSCCCLTVTEKTTYFKKMSAGLLHRPGDLRNRW